MIASIRQHVLLLRRLLGLHSDEGGEEPVQIGSGFSKSRVYLDYAHNTAILRLCIYFYN